jgi:peptidoglycan/LPS O-acetylase OafA/YrhL
MPGLDVVRGTAIVMVLVAHGLAENAPLWWGATKPATLILRDFLFTGAYGVQIFFVLSGFLITGILLDSRHRPDYYKSFYLRRTLRILPAYLLLLIVLKSCHWITLRFLIASLLYFSNMPRLFGATTDYGALWSLSVEEQFYLTWPFLVRKLSSKALLWLCISLVVLTPVLRFGLFYVPHSLGDIYYKTWDVMDFFAIGALLAMAARSPRFCPLIAKWSPWLVGVGLALILGLMFRIYPGAPMLNHLGEVLISEPWLILATGFVGLGSVRPSMAKSMLAKPFVFLGNISYGLYLCHQGVFLLVEKYWFPPTQISAARVEFLLLRFVVETAIAVLIAFVSRRTLEEFFLRLKPARQPA